MLGKFLASTAILTSLVLAGAAFAADKAVKAKRVGASVVKLMTRSGVLVSGDNDVTVAITDAKGAPKSGTIQRLSIFMPAMGSMAEMKADAVLRPARTPGVYTGTLAVEMKGPWTVTVSFKDEKGPHVTRFDIVAK